MACLGSVHYDPATAATASTAALLAMTALDTTNARITFIAPANGKVLVKLRLAQKGATSEPVVLFGVLDGSTVRARTAPLVGRTPGSAQLAGWEGVALVTGLTAGQSYTWDAAYGVQTLFAATQFGWGGPNNATASDAYGALSFEIWETAGMLAGVHYDPAAAVSKDTGTLIALTALDTTNLRLTFTVPSSGRVAVRMRGVCGHGGTTFASIVLGVLESSTVRMRQAPLGGYSQSGTPAVTDMCAREAFAVIGGLTPGAALTWDAAYGVETVVASTGLKYGGPNDAVGNDAFGGFGFEVWTA